MSTETVTLLRSTHIGGVESLAAVIEHEIYAVYITFSIGIHS